MEAELSCPVCNKPFVNPIILPCSHNICLGCSQSALTTAGGDKSATDRNGTQVDTEETPYITFYDMNHLYQSIGNLPCLKCPTCSKLFPIDGQGISGFPRNRLLENIVNRYYAKSNGIVYCQLCEETQPCQATVMCEQCEVAYCDRCCKTCHPSRGPLAKHSLIPPTSSKSPNKPTVVKCGSHSEENISMYCVFCRVPVCYVCLERGQHSGHEVKALGAMFKEQKAELLASMKLLDGKNNDLKNFIQLLNGNCSIIQENGLEFEASVVAQCDSLINFIQQRKVELIEAITTEMNSKTQKIKEQIKACEEKGKKVAGVLQYAHECLEGTDAASFLLVANSLNGRILNVVNHWSKEVKLEPSTGVELELTLDTSGAIQALHDLHFIELKAPIAPEIVPDECTVTNNAITLSWRPRIKQSCVDGYVVEIDDGTSSGKEDNFQEVYRGSCLECTVSGLQFNSTYRARVKGFNKAGEGAPSDEVYLTTSDVAWFSLDPATAHPDIVLTNDNSTTTCTSFDDRVVLGNIGFSRGCHYWEVTIDRYDGNPDPAVGVALASTIKDSILGKDDKAWCMYIDSSRSWFRHNNEHSNRRDGGVDVGSVIGVLLDIPNHKVTYYLNDQKRGLMRLPDTSEAFYAAFSLSRNVQITLHTGLEPPEEALVY